MLSGLEACRATDPWRARCRTRRPPGNRRHRTLQLFANLLPFTIRPMSFACCPCAGERTAQEYRACGTGALSRARSACRRRLHGLSTMCVCKPMQASHSATHTPSLHHAANASGSTGTVPEPNSLFQLLLSRSCDLAHGVSTFVVLPPGTKNSNAHSESKARVAA
jgi:hypothetical protein